MEKKIINEKLVISFSPHILKKDTTKSMIWTVIYALMPALIFGVYAFGFYSLLIVLFSVISSILTELVCLKLRKKEITLSDGSAVLTGLLIGLTLPPIVPLYIPIITSIFAIGIVKQAFGGLGENWANPAIAGRIFAYFAWPAKFNSWIFPFTNNFMTSDAVTSATPLGIVKSGLLENFKIEQVSNFPSNISDFFQNIFSGPLDMYNNALGNNLSYLDLFLGLKPGCIGEISVFLILIGAVFLIYKKIISLDIPVTFIGTVILLTWIFGGLQFGKGYFQGDFLFHVLTGGLALGAFFMATDIVTTPVTTSGRIIFGIGCGLITALIRLAGIYPEGVAFAILFMNMLTPILNKIIKLKPLG